MPASINAGPLVLCLAAPQDEGQPLMLMVQSGDDSIGKRLPSLALMRPGATVLDGQAAVQQQDALPRPAFQIAMQPALESRGVRAGLDYFT